MKGLALTLLASLLSGGLSAGADAPATGRPPRTIYVPVIKAEGLSKAERLMMTELLIKSIEQSTAFKVVGSPEDADLIYEGGVRQVR